MTLNFFNKRFFIAPLFFLFSIFIFPFALSSLFLISLSYCLLFSFFSFLFFIFLSNKNFKFLLNLKLLRYIFFISLHFLLCFFLESYPQQLNFKRFFLSLIYLLLVLIFSDLSSQALQKLNLKAIYSAFNFFSYFFLVVAYFSVFGFLFIHNGGKPVFYFSEPSHFALAFTPFFIYKITSSSKYESFLFFISSLNLAFVLPSATLLSTVLIYPALLFLPRQFHKLNKPFFYISSIFVVLFAFAFKLYFSSSIIQPFSSKLSEVSQGRAININTYVVSSLHKISSSFTFFNKDYFLSRLPIRNEPTSNLSLNVYMSGWSRAVINTKNTYGLGIGFQQLGYVGPEDKYLNFISLNNSPFGINEGGCVAAKLISEFGIFAIATILFYLAYCFKALKRIGSQINNYKLNHSNNLGFLMDIFYISFLIPLFIRSSGYFGPLLFILFISLLFFNRNKIS